MQVRILYIGGKAEDCNITYAEWQKMFKTLELRGAQVAEVALRRDNGTYDDALKLE